MADLIHLPIILLLLIGGLVLIVRSIFADVSKFRVERFAQRSRLTITPGNGNLVIRYLATTRRWRGCGLLLGLVLAAAWSARDGMISLNVLAAFSGWFVGAVIAEWRVAGATAPGPRATASLTPRRLRDRLGRGTRVLLAIEAGALLVLTVVGSFWVLPLAIGAVGALTLGLPALAARRALSRPQPADLPDDVRAADDAVRDRSLHVLAGSALALTSWPLALLAAGSAIHPLGLGGAIYVLGGVALIGAHVAGWLIATTPRPAPRDPAPAVQA